MDILTRLCVTDKVANMVERFLLVMDHWWDGLNHGGARVQPTADGDRVRFRCRADRRAPGSGSADWPGPPLTDVS